MSWEIVVADCVAHMKTLPEDSIDSIVTDPPYGLEFMGKEWDKLWTSRDKATADLTGKSSSPFVAAAVERYVGGSTAQAWHLEWATAALRVLKPGGHLLAFGGTRTYHRLASAIEDAGFEIRDTIDWVYANGFPKSHNVGAAIDRGPQSSDAIDGLLPDEERFCRWIRGSSGLTAVEVRRVIGSARFYTGEVEIVNTAASSEKPRLARRAMVPTADAWAKLLPHLKTPPPVWVVELVKNPPMEAVEGLIPWRPGKGMGTVAESDWAGWGTALKPAHEPIVVARKPLIGTVVENVLAHGTGALNIEAGRVGSPADRPGSVHPHRSILPGSDNSWDVLVDPPGSNPLGRWPPNLLLSHDQRCVRQGMKTVSANSHYPDLSESHPGSDSTVYKLGMALPSGIGTRTTEESVESWACAPGCPVTEMDRQSGDRPVSGSAKNGRPALGDDYGANNVVFPTGFGNRQGVLHNDEGGASRFFPGFAWEAEEVSFVYEPKASRSEREAGLETLPLTALARSNRAQTYLSEGVVEFNPEGGNGMNDVVKVRNFHPTVKPIALMRWLVRLVTPPSGRVLDPFAGSGTTGCATAPDGFQFTGIEANAEYAEIARARIAYWVQKGTVNVPATALNGRLDPKVRQLTLSDLNVAGDVP